MLIIKEYCVGYAIKRYLMDDKGGRVELDGRETLTACDYDAMCEGRQPYFELTAMVDRVDIHEWEPEDILNAKLLEQETRDAIPVHAWKGVEDRKEEHEGSD